MFSKAPTPDNLRPGLRPDRAVRPAADGFESWHDDVRRAENETVTMMAHGKHVADVVPSGELDRLRDAIEVLSTMEAAPGERIRVYSAERTVVDLMRLRHRLGEPLALGALRRFLRRRHGQLGQLLTLTRALDILGPLRAAVDVVRRLLAMAARWERLARRSC